MTILEIVLIVVTAPLWLPALVLVAMLPIAVLCAGWAGVLETFGQYKAANALMSWLDGDR